MVVISAPCGALDRRATRARRRALHVHGARAALPDAAAVLRALEIENVAQHPEQRHVGRDIHRRGFSVDLERERHLKLRSESNFIIRTQLFKREFQEGQST